MPADAGSRDEHGGPGPLVVLDAALTWTHGALQRARVADPALPTPCAGWDLRDLLLHMDDSLAALGEAALVNRVDLAPVDRPATAGPDVLVEQVCRRACLVRAAWGARATSAPVAVGDLRVDLDLLATAGAAEVVVHGWDVARTVGAQLVLPEDLAARLLPVALAVVTDDERAHRFAPALPPAAPTPSARLLAHLGRDATPAGPAGVSAPVQAAVAPCSP